MKRNHTPLIALGLGALLALAFGAALQRPESTVPSYTTEQLYRDLSRNPHNWAGRTIVIRGAIVAYSYSWASVPATFFVATLPPTEVGRCGSDYRLCLLPPTTNPTPRCGDGYPAPIKGIGDECMECVVDRGAVVRVPDDDSPWTPVDGTVQARRDEIRVTGSRARTI